MYKKRHTQNTLIQIYANVFKNLFLPNIVHAKNNTFTVGVHGSQDAIFLWHDLRRPALGGSTMATTSCDVMDFMVCVITSSALQQWYVTLVMPTVNRDNRMSSAQHMNFTGIICWKYDVNNLFKTSINDQLAQFL